MVAYPEFRSPSLCPPLVHPRRRVAHRYPPPELLPLPPAHLIFRVAGNQNTADFLTIGQRCALDLESALATTGCELGSFRRILDFGCGCGRTLRWYARAHRRNQFYGADIDAEAIAWCRGNLPFVRLANNRPEPPLPYRDEFFDLVYSISIFTHLKEESLLCWLEEVKRVLAPGGLFVFTIHGRSLVSQLGQELAAELDRKGHVFISDVIWAAIFGDWYGATYHTEQYIRDRVGEHFEILDQIARGMNGHQDVVIARKRAHA